MTTTLERVARAIRANASLASKADSVDAAKAALQALRQVDDETVEATKLAVIEWHEGYEDFREGARAIFTAAINHILSQTPNQGSER